MIRFHKRLNATQHISTTNARSLGETAVTGLKALRCIETFAIESVEHVNQKARGEVLAGTCVVAIDRKGAGISVVDVLYRLDREGRSCQRPEGL